jgi:glycogen synthase
VRKGSHEVTVVRVALLSYEVPPDTGHGGIGTYIVAAAAMLAARGHDVEVFSGARASARTDRDGRVVIHRIPGTRTEFRARVADAFAARHAAEPFDVLEAPEFEADYPLAIARCPDVPLVVKLHTPTFAIRRMMTEGWRYDQPAWRRAMWRYQNRWGIGLPRAPLDDPECLAIALADVVSSPSRAIADLVCREWQIPAERISLVPLPVQWPETPLAPAAVVRDRVIFVGRVEVRKGVVDLADAVPMVTRDWSGVEFLFVGADGEAADGGPSMQAYLTRRLGGSVRACRFTGVLPREALPALFAESTVAVFPSLWESFGYVCLEAMASGCPVIVTTGTGMQEMVDDGAAGVLIPPRSPRALAAAILSLHRDPARRANLAEAGRRRIRAAYATPVIAAQQEREYERARVERHRAGPRRLGETGESVPRP